MLFENSSVAFSPIFRVRNFVLSILRFHLSSGKYNISLNQSVSTASFHFFLNVLPLSSCPEDFPDKDVKGI